MALLETIPKRGELSNLCFGMVSFSKSSTLVTKRWRWPYIALSESTMA
jgi:hypothetical protein